MKIHLLTFAIAAFLGLGFGYVYSQTEQPRQAEGGWLLGASDDTERFRRLQQYLRGFDKPMWEVGERYRLIYEALQLENYDLAIYHWEKIRATVEGGTMKRPARQASADPILLNRNWSAVNQAFESRDRRQAWDGFGYARAVCMTCHVAENVAFVNNQPMFNETEPPASR